MFCNTVHVICWLRASDSCDGLAVAEAAVAIADIAATISPRNGSSDIRHSCHVSPDLAVLSHVTCLTLVMLLFFAAELTITQ